MSDLEVEEIGQADDEVSSIEEGKLLDYITDEPVKDTPKEQVRQRIARALFHEYGISVEDMFPDFKMKVDGRSKKVDIAIFEPGADKTPANLRRIVICDKEPRTGSRGAYKMRDHKQAENLTVAVTRFISAAPTARSWSQRSNTASTCGWAGSPCSVYHAARRRPTTTICRALPLPIGPSAWPTRSRAHDHLH